MTKYVLKETKETCVIVETYQDLFGEEMALIRTSNGDELSVPRDNLVHFLQE